MKKVQIIRCWIPVLLNTTTWKTTCFPTEREAVNAASIDASSSGSGGGRPEAGILAEKGKTWRSEENKWESSTSQTSRAPLRTDSFWTFSAWGAQSSKCFKPLASAVPDPTSPPAAIMEVTRGAESQTNNAWGKGRRGLTFGSSLQSIFRILWVLEQRHQCHEHLGISTTRCKTNKRVQFCYTQGVWKFCANFVILWVSKRVNKYKWKRTNSKYVVDASPLRTAFLTSSHRLFSVALKASKVGEEHVQLPRWTNSNSLQPWGFAWYFEYPSRFKIKRASPPSCLDEKIQEDLYLLSLERGVGEVTALSVSERRWYSHLPWE